MPTDWSDNIVISELQDEPLLSEELASVYERITRPGEKSAKNVVLNFAAVNYISSSHLSQMLRLRKRTIDSGKQLVVCSLSDHCWSVMLLTGLDRVFRFAPDPMTALATLQIEGGGGMEA